MNDQDVAGSIREAGSLISQYLSKHHMRARDLLSRTAGPLVADSQGELDAALLFQVHLSLMKLSPLLAKLDSVPPREGQYPSLGLTAAEQVLAARVIDKTFDEHRQVLRRRLLLAGKEIMRLRALIEKGNDDAMKAAAGSNALFVPEVEADLPDKTTADAQYWRQRAVSAESRLKDLISAKDLLASTVENKALRLVADSKGSQTEQGGFDSSSIMPRTIMHHYNITLIWLIRTFSLCEQWQTAHELLLLEHGCPLLCEPSRPTPIKKPIAGRRASSSVGVYQPVPPVRTPRPSEPSPTGDDPLLMRNGMSSITKKPLHQRLVGRH